MANFVVSTNAEGSSHQIKSILAGKNVRIASAFLGIGAEKQVPVGARLICDIGMGGTNPEVLKWLREKLGKNLKHIPDFHAKIYISDKGCAVGSANLSSRGVGFLSQATLIEAAVMLSPESEAAAAAASWFEDIWNSGKVIGDHEIAWAKARWIANKRGLPQGNGKKYKGFIDALDDQTGIANDWKFILTRENYSKGVKEEATKREREVADQAAWAPDKKLHFYEDLGATETYNGHYIMLHKRKSGKTTVNAMRFVANFPIQVEKQSYEMSYFATLHWKDVGIPKPSAADLKCGGRFDNAIAAANIKHVAEPISARKLAKILMNA